MNDRRQYADIHDFVRVHRVAVSPECWRWVKCRNPAGYGIVWFDGRKQYAHRVAQEIAAGPIPEGMQVCHTCDRPECVNPAHLYLGTQLENIADMTRKGRRRRAKLSIEQVENIRADGRRRSVIAAEYGIAEITVTKIRMGKSWRHLTPTPPRTSAAGP